MPLIRVENYPNVWAIYLFRNPDYNVETQPRVTEQALAGGLANWKRELAYALREAAMAVEVPGINTSDLVTVVFGGEQVIEGDKTLIIFVEGLLDRPNRTKEVRDRLAKTLGEAAKPHRPKSWKVEVFVRRFNTDKDSTWDS